METILRLIVVLSVAVVAVGDPEMRLLNHGCSLLKVINITLFNENLDAVLECLRAKFASPGFATSQQVKARLPFTAWPNAEKINQLIRRNWKHHQFYLRRALTLGEEGHARVFRWTIPESGLHLAMDLLDEGCMIGDIYFRFLKVGR
eukprot:Gb_28659 [translate_table: standard]